MPTGALWEDAPLLPVILVHSAPQVFYLLREKPEETRDVAIGQTLELKWERNGFKTRHPR